LAAGAARLATRVSGGTVTVIAIGTMATRWPARLRVHEVGHGRCRRGQAV